VTAEIDQRTVIGRAQAHAEADGFAWNFDTASRGKRLLSEARRRLYIQKAVDELAEEIARPRKTASL